MAWTLKQAHGISEAQKWGMRHLERAMAAAADGPQTYQVVQPAWSESDSEPVPPA